MTDTPEPDSDEPEIPKSYATFEEDMRIVGEAAHRLAEHFDCVQIVVSSHHGGHSEPETAFRSYGIGNMFARIAMCEYWADQKRNEYSN